MTKTLIAGYLAATLFVLGGCSTVAPVAELPASISNATTPEDHLKIADYFAQKAVAYDAEAQQHDRMAKTYIGPFNRGNPESWASHCRALRDRLAGAALEARELEKAHRQIAASTQ